MPFKYKALRKDDPRFQGLNNAQVADAIAEESKASTSAEREALFKSLGMATGTGTSGFFRGVGSGLNFVPDSVAQRLPMPQSWKDGLHSLDEALPGEEYGHMAGNMAGSIGGLFLPTGALGILGKAGKVAKGLEGAEKAARLTKLATRSNAVLGFGRGVKETQNRGQYYNEGKVNPAAALAGGTLEAVGNVLPAFTSMRKAMAGSGATGALQMGIENLIQAENGVADGPNVPMIALGGALGAAMGGGGHIAFNSPTYTRRAIAGAKKGAGAVNDAVQSVENWAFKGAPRTNPVPPKVAPVVPPMSPLAEALLKRTRGVPSPMAAHPNGDQLAAQDTAAQTMTALKEDVAELRHWADMRDASFYPEGVDTQAVLADGASDARFYRVGGKHTAGEIGDQFLIDDDGNITTIDPGDLLNRYFKSRRYQELDIPERGPEGQGHVLIRDGYHPVLKSTPDSLENGDQVYIVGRKPNKNKMQERFLIVRRGEFDSYQQPQEVGAMELRGAGKTAEAYENLQHTPESVRNFLAPGGERPLSPQSSLDGRIEALLAERDKLQALKAHRQARGVVNVGRNATPPRPMPSHPTSAPPPPATSPFESGLFPLPPAMLPRR